MLGTTAGAPLDDRLDAARVVIETFVAHLRTRPHRIEHGILVSRFEDDRAPLQACWFAPASVSGPSNEPGPRRSTVRRERIQNR